MFQNSGSDLEAVQSILDSVTNMIQSLNSNDSENTTENITEVLLPPSDMLLSQFSSRLVYNIIDLAEERLTTTYWLSLPQDDGELEAEHVSYI